VNVTKNGEHCEVLVDDYFPTKNSECCFTTAHGNELWVLLLEKAWAKLHGDYCKIIGGLCHEAFRDMTGAPAWLYTTQTATDLLWYSIQNADR